MDLMELKTKKRVVGAALLLGATIFASSAVASMHEAPDTGDSGAGTGMDSGAGTGGSGAGTGDSGAGNGMTPGTITVQDINYDQILDIITSGGPGNVLNVFLGNGDGTFNNIFQAGLGLGVQLGYIAEEDVPEITFYQNLMAIHLATTCCPDDGAPAGDAGSDSGSMPSGLQTPDASSVFCAPGIPSNLFNLAGGGAGC